MLNLQKEQNHFLARTPTCLRANSYIEGERERGRNKNFW